MEMKTTAEREREKKAADERRSPIAATLAAACIEPGTSAKDAVKVYRAVLAELGGAQPKVSAKKA